MNFKKILRKFTPEFLLGWYHYAIAFFGAVLYGFPSRNLIVIGVTGTSGKSTTVDFITRILEENGENVASISSVRFKIRQKEWKNQLKMTMPGRFNIQRFLRQAVNAGCMYVILEVTSEGIRQFRHKFINFDMAVFTNLSPEHIESHGGFENYRNEKLKLFKTVKNVHVVNADDQNAKYFLEIPAKKNITFSLADFANSGIKLNVLGEFNRQNAAAAAAAAAHYGVTPEIYKKALEKVTGIPGRMEIISQNPLVVVDYAHTPVQLEKVLQTFSSGNSKLVCVLGSCGGGRDKWKRPELGRLAAQYCQEVIITNEDPYDEDPLEIMEQVAQGVGEKPHSIVLDRKEAIKKALEIAKPEDTVVITGKGSEMWMCLSNGKKIPWSDAQIVKKALGNRSLTTACHSRPRAGIQNLVLPKNSGSQVKSLG